MDDEPIRGELHRIGRTDGRAQPAQDAGVLVDRDHGNPLVSRPAASIVARGPRVDGGRTRSAGITRPEAEIPGVERVRAQRTL